MAKLLRRGAWFFLALVALVAGWSTYAVRGSLAQLDGDLQLVGLSAPASIQRDADGVATILAANSDDAMRALGYVHAQERFFEMVLLRRSAAGELSALFGPAALTRDRQVRVHRMRARMNAEIQRADSSERAAIDAYTEGVQQGLTALRNRPWAYWLLRQTPEQWRAEDTLLAAAAMAFDLHDASNRREYMLSRLDHYFPTDVMALLAADGSEFDAPMMGEPRAPITLPPGPRLPRPLDESEGHQPSEPTSPPMPVDTAVDGVSAGSNNFAVAGSLTADGRAILADDMHLGLRAPNIWFRARLRYPDARAVDGKVDVSGFSLPGVPGIVAGSNGHVAWGFTNSYGDWLDWVRITWRDREAGRYATQDGDQVVEVFDELIKVAGAADEHLMVRQTRWGPLLHEETNEDGSESALALMWTIHRSGSLNLGLLDLATAKDVDEAIAVGQRVGMPPQNLLVADSSGRVAWTIAGRIPQRLGECDPLRPLDPLAGCDWGTTWLDPAQAPSLVDPEDGRLWSANSRVADGDALRLIGAGSYDLGARQRQIRDALRARKIFSEGDMLGIQLDDRALFMQRWWQVLRDVVAKSEQPELKRMAQASMTWEGRASVDSVSYRLARGFRGMVIERIAGQLFADAKAGEGVRWQEPSLTQFEAFVWQLITERPDGWLDDTALGWETLLQSAATDLAKELETVGPLGQRTWGERNTARICHPLATALPGSLANVLCMPRDPLPGDSHMPRVQGPSFGASERMVVAPGHESEGIIHAPAGQSGHPFSPFWDTGYSAWADGRPTAFLPGEAKYRLALRP